MTTRAEYEALAVRVETEEPSRELRYAIAEALGLDVDPAPRMLDSLDAAVTLVPNHAVWLRKSEKVMTVAFYGRGEEWGIHIDATGHNPAAALTAAALRARAQEANHG